MMTVLRAVRTVPSGTGSDAASTSTAVSGCATMTVLRLCVDWGQE